MAAILLRQQVIDYVDQLDDEQTMRVITFIETLPKQNRQLQNSKTAEERAKAKQALDELFTMSRPAKNAVSTNGRTEIADTLRSKYEGLD